MCVYRQWHVNSLPGTFQHHTGHSIHIVVITAAILYFYVLPGGEVAGAWC
jgi:hypothetical protein